MSLITLPKLSQSGANEWADVEDNDVAIRDVVNGDLDDDNIADGAGISISKLAAITSQYVKLTSGIKAPSGDLTLGGEWQDIPGTSQAITAAVKSILKVTAFFQMDVSGDAGWEGSLAGTIAVDGTRQTPYAIYKAESQHQNEIFGATVGMVYRVELEPGEHTVKMQGILLGALLLTTHRCESENTRYLWELTAAL
jgi:hypothetical protein